MDAQPMQCKAAYVPNLFVIIIGNLLTIRRIRNEARSGT